MEETKTPETVTVETTTNQPSLLTSEQIRNLVFQVFKMEKTITLKDGQKRRSHQQIAEDELADKKAILKNLKQLIAWLTVESDTLETEISKGPIISQRKTTKSLSNLKKEYEDKYKDNADMLIKAIHETVGKKEKEARKFYAESLGYEVTENTVKSDE